MMGSFVILLLLAFALNLDSFGVGVTYGLRNIRIPFLSVLIIAICSCLVMLVSMKIGSGLAAFLPEQLGNSIGAFILIGIGLWALYSNRPGRDDRRSCEEDRDFQPSHGRTTGHVWTIEIKQLGLVINILKKPVMADVDRSGTITTGEAVLLGCALSLDSFGAGLGAGMVGLSIWTVAIVIAMTSAVFLLTGLQVGFRFRKVPWLRQLYFIPGTLLIVMGFSRLWW